MTTSFVIDLLLPSGSRNAAVISSKKRIKTNMNKLVKLEHRLAQSLEVPDMIVQDEFIVLRPIFDGILRCLLFESSDRVNENFTVEAVILPLFAQLEGIELTFSKNILRKRIPGVPSNLTVWKFEEEANLVEALKEQAIPFFALAEDASTFAKNARKINFQRADITEKIILSELVSGNVASARIGIALAKVKYLFYPRDSNQVRLMNDTKELARLQISDVQSILLKRIDQNLKFLKLESLGPYVKLRSSE